MTLESQFEVSVDYTIHTRQQSGKDDEALLIVVIILAILFASTIIGIVVFFFCFKRSVIDKSKLDQVSLRRFLLPNALDQLYSLKLRQTHACMNPALNP